MRSISDDGCPLCGYPDCRCAEFAPVLKGESLEVVCIKKEFDVVLGALLRVYIAITQREVWMVGETESEALDHALDVLANNEADPGMPKHARWVQELLSKGK